MSAILVAIPEMSAILVAIPERWGQFTSKWENS